MLMCVCVFAVDVGVNNIALLLSWGLEILGDPEYSTYSRMILKV